MKNEQLMLDFTDSVKSYRDASDKMIASLEAVVLSSASTTAKKASIKASAQASEDLRKKLNKIVKLHARHKNLHWREVWRVMYERLRAQTGFDAWVKATQKGITPLEAILAAGKGPKLLQIGAAL